jgi:hypothetical protein
MGEGPGVYYPKNRAKRISKIKRMIMEGNFHPTESEQDCRIPKTEDYLWQLKGFPHIAKNSRKHVYNGLRIVKNCQSFQ